MNLEAALEYARKHQLQALVASRNGKIELETYENGFTRDDAHPLYSGTKSFWGVAALAASDDKIIDLEEPVSETLSEWSGDVEKREITPRMLLQMTAGYGFGGLGSAVPGYERALGMELKNPPGSKFTYSGIPLQVFGAYFARKLAAGKQTPHEYLRERVLKPAGVTVSSWRSLPDGTQTLPTGAALTASAWLTYGRYVLKHARDLAEAFAGSTANPRYGLCWWLGAPHAPDDLVYASGSAGQALYLVPSLSLAIVRFGKSASYKHEAFMRKLFA